MNRKQLLVNGAVIALAIASTVMLWRTRDRPGSAELESRKNKLLPSFHKEDVRRLVLTKAGRTLELVRDAAADDFRIVRPWPERADTATVNQLLASLDLASWLRQADTAPSEQNNADTLTLEIGLANATLKLRLGQPAPSPTGARYAEILLDGKAPIRVVVSQGVSSELDVPFIKFRETRLLEYGRRELKKLTLTSKASRLELEQREHGAFFLVQDDHRELVAPAALERVLTALSRVATEQLIEPEQARPALQSDPLMVAIEPSELGAAPLTLSFGNGCYQAPELATVLREQAGKAPRAGCVPSDVASALRVGAGDLRLDGAFAATLDAVEELSLRDGGQKLELARKDKGWILRSAGNRELGLEAGNQRVLALLGAHGERPSNADAKALGLEPPAGEMVIQVTGADEATHREERVRLGQQRADGSRCLERTLDSVRLCFDKAQAEAFNADAALLRAPEVLHFAPSELAELTIQTPELTERLTRSADGSYTLEEPKGFHHDGALVADAVQTLGTLQALRWVAADSAAKHGFTAPRVHVVARLSSGVTHDLTVGASADGGAYARLAADPTVFVLGAAPLADLETPLLDRALCPFPRGELSRIELKQGARSLVLTRSGDAWQASGVTPQKAGELVDALSALRAEQALHIGPARPAEGLDKPRSVITFTDQQGKSARLTLGARGTLGDEPSVYARIEGVDATFALLSRTAEDLTSF